MCISQTFFRNQEWEIKIFYSFEFFEKIVNFQNYLLQAAIEFEMPEDATDEPEELLDEDSEDSLSADSSLDDDPFKAYRRKMAPKRTRKVRPEAEELKSRIKKVFLWMFIAVCK